METVRIAPLHPLPTPANDDAMLRDTEAAALLGVKTKTLANWRCQGREDLPFYRVGGRAIRYRRGDVIAFRDRHRLTSTSDAGAAA